MACNCRGSVPKNCQAQLVLCGPALSCDHIQTGSPVHVLWMQVKVMAAMFRVGQSVRPKQLEQTHKSFHHGSYFYHWGCFGCSSPSLCIYPRRMACSCAASPKLLYSLFFPRSWTLSLGGGQGYFVFHVGGPVLDTLAFVWFVWEHTTLSNCLPPFASFSWPISCQGQQAMAYMGMPNFSKPLISRQPARQIWRFRQNRYG